jgi:hypothetical protein
LHRHQTPNTPKRAIAIQPSSNFQGQIESLKNYLNNIQQEAHTPSKYNALSDAELDELTLNRRIKADPVVENGKLVRTAWGSPA